MTDSHHRHHPRPAWLLPTPNRRDEQIEPADLKDLLRHLMQGRDLERHQAACLLNAILDESAADSQIAAALVALAVKGETVDELAGMADVMRARANRIKTTHAIYIDTAGTGSSYAKTFNISTAAAFVIAGAGMPVAKHGSRAATSRSGSADVLGELGVNVTATPAVSEMCLNEIGLCFMFAPLYHNATARVASIRRQLGVHTTFNLLGPLTNPAGAPRQIVGVWHKSLAEQMAQTLCALGTHHAWVVHGSDGLDELTLNGHTHVAEARNGVVRTIEISPSDAEFETASIQHLRGGDAAANAKLIRSVLDTTRRDEARDIVVFNAAAALLVGGKASDLLNGRKLAEESIDSGAALRKLESLISMTNKV